MSFPIQINSRILKNQNPNNLKYRFVEPIRLDKDKRYELALINASIPYSLDNISHTLENNTFRFSINNNPYQTITIPAGNYSLTNICNEVIPALLKKNDAFIVVEETDIFPFTVFINNAIGRVYISVDNTNFTNVEVDFSNNNTSTFHKLIGFENELITADKLAENRVDIFSHSSFSIVCTLLDSGLPETTEHINYANQILYSSPFAGEIQGLIEIDPHTKLYFPIEYATTIREINIKLVLDNGTMFETNGEHTDFFIHLKEI